jgi:UDPglucose 6-dehydrogenase
MARQSGVPCELIEAIDRTNEEQKKLLGAKIVGYFGSRGGIQGKKIAVLGLAFKPDTDDMREAPSVVLIRDLIDAGACVRLFDPVAMDNAKKVVPPSPGITWCDTALSAASGADAIAIATEWSQFRDLDMKRLLEKMNGTAFFDGRNLFSPDQMTCKGFDYVSIGRQAVCARPEQAAAEDNRIHVRSL